MSFETTNLNTYEAKQGIVSSFKLPVILAYAQTEAGNYGLHDFIWNYTGEVNDLSGTYTAADTSTQTYGYRTYAGCDATGNIVVARRLPGADADDPQGYKLISYGLNDSQIQNWQVTDIDVQVSVRNSGLAIFFQPEGTAIPGAVEMDAIHSADPIRDHLDRLQLRHLQAQTDSLRPRLLLSQQASHAHGQEANGWLSLDGIHQEPMIGLVELMTGLRNLSYQLGRLATQEAVEPVPLAA